MFRPGPWRGPNGRRFAGRRTGRPLQGGFAWSEPTRCRPTAEDRKRCIQGDESTDEASRPAAGCRTRHRLETSVHHRRRNAKADYSDAPVFRDTTTPGTGMFDQVDRQSRTTSGPYCVGSAASPRTACQVPHLIAFAGREPVECHPRETRCLNRSPVVVLKYWCHKIPVCRSPTS